MFYALLSKEQRHRLGHLEGCPERCGPAIRTRAGDRCSVRRILHGLEPMVLERLVTIVTAVALAAGIPLAHAVVPDPLWIAGIYDAADEDDAVQAVADGFGLRLPADEGPIIVTPVPSTASIGAFVPAPPSLHARSSRVDRAPPRI